MRKVTNPIQLLQNQFAQLSKFMKLHYEQIGKYSSLSITVFIVMAESLFGLQDFSDGLIQLARIPNLNPILNLNKNVHSIY